MRLPGQVTSPKGHWSESYIVVRSGRGANLTLHTLPHPFSVTSSYYGDAEFTCVLLLGTIILRMLHDMLRYLSLQDIQRINRLSSVYIKRVWLRLT